jgi:hypothetical protein
MQVIDNAMTKVLAIQVLYLVPIEGVRATIRALRLGDGN